MRDTLPTPGRIVEYTLTAQDAEQVNRRRLDFAAYHDAHFSSQPARPNPGSTGATGHVAHLGNKVEAGDAFPAMVVRVNASASVNLQVHLDGTDVLWAPSRVEGDGEGRWFWPPRV